jgi:hypothetical protein
MCMYMELLAACLFFHSAGRKTTPSAAARFNNMHVAYNNSAQRHMMIHVLLLCTVYASANTEHTYTCIPRWNVHLYKT